LPGYSDKGDNEMKAKRIVLKLTGHQIQALKRLLVVTVLDGYYMNGWNAAADKESYNDILRQLNRR
jgi:hypothetical protein